MKPTTHQAMARFRASLLRRASAVAWVVLIIVAAQAVRTEIFVEPGFWIPMSALAALLIISTAIHWENMMATSAAPWISAAWLSGLVIGISALAIVPELTATAQPILFGIAAVSGLLLAWWAHAFMTVFIALAMQPWWDVTGPLGRAVGRVLPKYFGLGAAMIAMLGIFVGPAHRRGAGGAAAGGGCRARAGWSP